MDLTGEQRLAAPRARVWAALNDPAVLKACIPGCESLEVADNGDMLAKVVAKIGPVKASFSGKVSFQNVVPNEGYTLSGEGQGGVAGFAKGGADVKLVDDGEGTLMTYAAKAQVGGKLAQLGSRLVDSTARMMADQFFAKFAEMVGGPPAAAPATVEPSPSASVPVAAIVPGDAFAPDLASPVFIRPPGLPMWAWIAAIGILAGAVVWLGK